MDRFFSKRPPKSELSVTLSVMVQLLGQRAAGGTTQLNAGGNTGTVPLRGDGVLPLRGDGTLPLSLLEYVLLRWGMGGG